MGTTSDDQYLEFTAGTGGRVAVYPSSVISVYELNLEEADASGAKTLIMLDCGGTAHYLQERYEEVLKRLEWRRPNTFPAKSAE